VNAAFAMRIQVLRSLRRSRVRTEVAMYLYKIYPGFVLMEEGKNKEGACRKNGNQNHHRRACNCTPE
jgi:predicted transcriptional regulator with HTH domain